MKKRKHMIKHIFKKNINLIIYILVTAIIMYLFKNILQKEYLFDVEINNFIDNLRTNALLKIMRIFTNFGSAVFLISLSILMYIFIKNKKICYSISFNLFIIFIFNRLLKFLVERPRPNYAIFNEEGFSFPSAHAMISTAFYGYLIYLIYNNIDNMYLKCFLIIILLILIILICFSRLYFGVHYFTDVIGGIIIAITYLCIFTKTSLQK